MKREIKFRGKRIDKDVFVFGDMLTGMGYKKGKFYILPHLTYYPGDCNDLDGYEVIPETVGQFTGLLDKNDKEIYEGDVLRFYDEDIPFKVVFAFVEGVFMPVYTDKLHVRSSWPVEDMEIVGNIFDNPELLKGGEE